MDNFLGFQHETIYARRINKIKSIDAYLAKRKDELLVYEPGRQKLAEDDVV